MIEVGEYVRTVDGKIGIFVRYSSRKEDSFYKSPANCFIRLNNRKSDLQCFRDYIVKHSKNIIDLIEVGDIVRILLNEKTGETTIFVFESQKQINILNEKNCHIIKSIVTKEQFAQAEYKIERGE